MSTSKNTWYRRAGWGAGLVLLVVLVVGLVLLLIGRFSDSSNENVHSSTATDSPKRTVKGGHSEPGDDEAKLRALENKIANRPMLQSKSDDTSRKVEVDATTKPLKLPRSDKKVDGVVASGFPMTPAGAVAQLAALDRAAFHNFDVDQGRRVHDAFALPGAVGVDQWIGTALPMSYFKRYADQNPSTTTATYTPVQGLIKGTADDGRFTVVCTLGRLSYGTPSEDVRVVGVPDCARMQWHEDRWMIAPGEKPAKPTMTWPRSALSYKAGFRDLVEVRS